MIYRKTNLSTLPHCCASCPNFKITTIEQGGIILSRWVGCAILPDELPTAIANILPAELKTSRSPTCPLVKIDGR